ncbi:hypothetical protein Pint_25618 [Pistacia integerrima]|uniref:Uncharacterized protein n=1 Tax=Pistacia integerrima TaxID=434235 RepID=A0ACC0YEK3_9ROSI|nr:hypothetical protein Pint_25618 [Pistacia integerrima]
MMMGTGMRQACIYFLGLTQIYRTCSENLVSMIDCSGRSTQ